MIAGQGTAAANLVEAGPLDALFVCLGGGGLLAGSLLAAAALAPACRVYESSLRRETTGKCRSGRGSIVRIEVPVTIADGAQTQSLGRHTFEIIRREVADILTVSDALLIECMRWCADRLDMVVEPTGCLGIAAMLAQGRRLAGQRVGVIVSGGNVDSQRFAELLGR